VNGHGIYIDFFRAIVSDLTEKANKVKKLKAIGVMSKIVARFMRMRATPINHRYGASLCRNRLTKKPKAKISPKSPN
jgi:hypothetical protein